MARKSSAAPTSQRVYEDVTPRYRLEPGKDADTLVVDLTEFKDDQFRKEQLKVKIDNYGSLKVSGLRPVGGGNLWRRFEKDFRISEDCDTGEIKAKFDAGVLSVVMPKRIRGHPSSPPPPPAAATPAPKPGQNAAAEDGGVTEPAEARADTPLRAADEGGKVAAAAAPGGDRKDEASTEKEGAQSPPTTPAAATEGLEFGMRRRGRPRPRWVVVTVVVVVTLILGIGYYCLFHREGRSPDGQKSPEKLVLSEAGHGLQQVLET